jgi:hypothetical protein
MIDYIKTLREFNAWWIGAETPLPSPEETCNAIDALIEEVERLRKLATCGCGDEFTEHELGTCVNCLAGMAATIEALA